MWLCAALTAVMMVTALVAVSATPANASPTAPALTSISLGQRASCGLDASGQIWCWGSNDPQISANYLTTTTNHAYPVQIASAAVFTQVSASNDHVCALTTAGLVYCWGLNASGQLGDGTTTNATTPVLLTGGLTFSQISSGNAETCGLVGTTVYCWGNNSNGQLGDGTTTNHSAPAAVSGAIAFKQIRSGSSTTCGLSTGGAAYCWGYNASGQVGDNSTTNRLVPTAVSGAYTFSSISITYTTACGLVSGTAYCWGNNPSGQVGDGSTTNRLVPTAVSGGQTFVAIAAGLNDTCGVTSASASYCWGTNGFGQVGDGTSTSRYVPTAVAGGYSFVWITTAWDHSCGMTTANQIKCWGYDLGGSLATGQVQPEIHTPTPLAAGSPTLTSVSVGRDANCGLTNTGSAYCWGRNGNNQLGNNAGTDSAIPTAVSGGLSFQQVSVGIQHACAITIAGAGYCWGTNIGGVLGDGTTSARGVPTAISGGLAFSTIGTQYQASCGLVSGAAYCWGDNTYGQLGDGTTTAHLTPAVISGGLTFSSISVGSYHACGLTAVGAAYCWGANSNGQIGDNTTNQRNSPTLVLGGYTWASISAGEQYTCGVTTSHVGYCWGFNGAGQIGDGSGTQRLIPTAIAGGLSVQQIVVGTPSNAHTCALTTANIAYCWGTNTYGSVGDGSFNNTKYSPTAVSTSLTFSSISANGHDTCAITTSGNNTYCWGYNGYGGLGYNAGIFSTPVDFQFANATVVASAIIDPTFTFSIGNQASACNGESNFVSSGGAATAVSFGHLSSAANVSAGQSLSVASNAGGGFAVYVRGAQSSQNLRSSIYNWTDVSGTYSSPSVLGSGERFGYTYKDSTPASSVTNPGSAQFAAVDATNRSIMGSASSAAGLGCISFDAQTAQTTPAGSYQAAIIYLAIPTF